MKMKQVDCVYVNQLSITKISTNKRIRIDFEKQSKNSIPKYNKDNMYYTPAFQNEQQIIKNDFQLNLHKCLHRQKIKIQIQQIDQQQIKIAKPNLKNRYCMICKHKFQDYLQHIKLSYHTQKINQSSFNQDILIMCNKFKNKNITSNPQQQQKQITDQVKKKIKKQQQTFQLQYFQITHTQNQLTKNQFQQDIKVQAYLNQEIQSKY